MLAHPDKLRAYAALMRIDRPIGVLLLLWPTYWALWLAAGGNPPLGLFLIFTMGTWLMRAAGCVINDFFDRDFDRQVARTCQRPLAAGQITRREALVLFILLLLLAAALLPFLNRLTILLALPAVAISIAYPLFKRFTHLPQAFLGIAFSFGIPMAFAAVLDRVPSLAWWLMLANFCWVMAYDTAYAMSDRPDDLKAGVRSTAILFGRFDWLAIALFDAAAIVILAAIGLHQNLHWPFWVGLSAAALLMAFQQRWLDGDRDAALRAFLHNNWVGLVIFWGISAGLAH
ncbi:4-hydroxybenzoate octaprenyltransferase [Acidithiobacillus caldus]|jgi:4-hydroxybenzoate polyprenyltransferase|uniref:4-hydroxybenzoate octaprenyltransferase n=3 Tax=Acidithiobacillus caldus TaxID=33059 RepID=F9ZSC2_ACICS|nr:4-hydroxybenzoate octaprenyltransferase [Acidithiobacillus caldus]AEK57170.1 4-hydroxybenzoate polyprenyltransferase [Acidithiobacillus caldus SM-1]AIA54421.1 4-hydroxybenzoate polyprenyltransferase [Acidithiobacillus caldus ATCC 51756]AUW31937.1 4-hydroxybenzoate octaprenyltransferase [Acidithiobacillus caldus]MBU2728610.1 4-hydroxybenzoate octaprenyltransferase [Acidithiobacillus caldus]MBU2735434.1 4-hydroxybenzoate octaprenyltransferase [Acidithiobacillus caldus ATCC 51756]